MAEAIVSLAIERISDLLINEAAFLSGVNEEVESLKAELTRMHCFLKDADSKPQQDERLRNRVSEIRTLAYDAEDVIDSFILKAAQRRDSSHGIIKKFTSVFTKPFHLHVIKVQVKAIQTKLKSISEILPAYEISGEGVGSSSTSRVQQWLRRTYSHVEGEDVVSLEVSTKDVLAQLMTEEDRLHVIVSIIGMGGIGKTTLARNVYNHVDVRRHFDCLAWVSISQQWNPREVLLDVLMKVQPGRESTHNLNENQLIKRLYDVLKEKRYLLVLDDIWRSEDWDILKPAFPRGRKGSKILFTTRNKHVALHADPCNSPMELPFLTDDEGWNLLSRKAFPRNKTNTNACSEEFKKLGREMAKQCGGLPLAIVVLGGLLATKQSLAQWKMVQRNLQGHSKGFQQQDHPYGAVNRILVLSYNDLPYHLKPCFLYLGHYPEDWEISKKELIRLWIAEGFISPSLETREMLMEDVGEQFLEELINRSLVQVGRRDYTGTNAKTCRIHDLLKDLCMEKAREENFLEIVQPWSTESVVNLTASMPRRIAMHLGKRSVDLMGEHPKLRSLLLLFEKNYRGELNISKWKSFKFLRVLNVVRRDDEEWHVSSEIGELYHLRYLKLSGEDLILPRSIGKLKRLHTLHLHWVKKVVIPNVLFKLERLRHIVFSANPWFLPDNIVYHWQPRFCSRNIETLKYVVVDRRLIKDNVLLRWTNIQCLGITFNQREHVQPILTSLTELHRLVSLSLNMNQDDEMNFLYPDLEPLCQCDGLSKIKIRGRILEEEDPNVGHHHALEFLPPNIVKLTLEWSAITQDPMGVLENLPCLRILRLMNGSYVGCKMICSTNGFPQLDSLQMVGVPELQELEIEEGAMPRLRSLHLEYMLELKMLPEGLKYITTLQQLTLKGMNWSLIKRVKVRDGNGRQGEDFNKVHHIPSIQILSR